MRLPYIVAVVALTQMGATDCGQVIKDPGFDLWCGDSLCSWKTERGTIARVPTWHEGDSGVQLVGDDTAIEQLASFNSSDGNCIKFDLVANVDDNAEVFLNVDVEGDGTLEMHERLPTSTWQPLTYSIPFKIPFDGVRFEIAKKGSGNAVVANIGATTSDTCTGLTPLDPGPRKNGAACSVATDCLSNICMASPTPVSATWGFNTVCMGCVPNPNDPQSTCGAGSTCGLTDPVAPIYAIPVACIAQHSREIGDRCLGNDDCASTLCVHQNNQGVCASCNSSTCNAGGSCRAAWIEPTIFGDVAAGPTTCSNGTTGDVCAANGDCASGHCNGAVAAVCADGRSCATRDECPVDTNLIPGECTTVGIHGGSCE